MNTIMSLKEWQALAKDANEMIRSCSTVHVVDGLNSMTIGMGPKMWTVPDHSLCSPTMPSRSRPSLLYTNISTTTDTRIDKPVSQTRAEICKTLAANGFSVSSKASAEQYWSDLRHSVFVASPEGNGVDCHRTYEALWAGAIPIVQSAHRAHIEAVYGNVPLLWTDDYSEINNDYLLAQLDRFEHTEAFDFSRLHFSKLRGREQHQCRFRTQIWKDVTDSGRNMPNQWPVHQDHFKVRLHNMRHGK